MIIALFYESNRRKSTMFFNGVRLCNACMKPLEHANNNQVVCDDCWHKGMENIRMHNITKTGLSRIWGVSFQAISIRYARYTHNVITLNSVKSIRRRYRLKVSALKANKA